MTTTQPASQMETLAARLDAYMDAQGEEAGLLRQVEMPAFPWPNNGDNPMLEYLVEKTCRIVAEDGLMAAIAWLAVHAWREGAIEALSKNS